MPIRSHPLSSVRERRTIANLKAAYLAHELGCTEGSFGRLERGERRVYLDKALRLAQLLGCSVEDLARAPTLNEKIELLKAGEAVRELQDRVLAAGLNKDEGQLLADLDAAAVPTTVPSHSTGIAAPPAHPGAILVGTIAAAPLPADDESLRSVIADWGGDDDDGPDEIR